jgi:rhombotail lipoprotein
MTHLLPRGNCRRRVSLVAALLAMPIVVTGCGSLDGFFGSEKRHQHGSTPLVDYLYGDTEPPQATAQVELQMPIVIGLTFLPTARGSGPTAVERDAVLQSIRERFSKLAYVRDIVIVPDYYLGNRRGSGFDELQRVAQLQRLDVIALVSHDQLSQTSQNKRSLAYLTIAGAFLVRGNEQATHTLLDLAVVEPRSRSLLLRSGGTSSLQQSSTAIELQTHRDRQQTQGFAQATEVLNDNFARELVAFEKQVREGRAPIRVVDANRSRSGALDILQLAFLMILVVCAARSCLSQGTREDLTRRIKS